MGNSPYINPTELFNSYAQKYEDKPITTDIVDKIFAFIYLVVGYLFIYTFTSETFESNIAIFTGVYPAVVLAYIYAKGKKPTLESFFWLVCLECIGIFYAFWSVMQFFQIVFLIGLAAYWTLSACNCLIDNKTSSWFLKDLGKSLITVPFYNFACLFVSIKNTCGKTKTGKGILSVLLGVVITLPILIVVLPLLSSADSQMAEILNSIGEYFLNNIASVFFRIIFGVPVAAYLFGLLYGSLNKRHTDHTNIEATYTTLNNCHKIADTTIYTTYIIICIVYMLFIGLQSNYFLSGFFGVRPGALSYSEYARSGFFELCVISVINMAVLIIANTFCKTKREDNKFLKILNIVLSVLTILLIATAMSKMVLYIVANGFTVKRILTTVFMLWLAIVFILNCIFQYKKITIVTISVVTGTILFSLLCIAPLDHMITSYNTAFGF